MKLVIDLYVQYNMDAREGNIQSMGACRSIVRQRVTGLNFKMVLFRGPIGGEFGRVFSLGLLLLVTSRVSRQQGINKATDYIYLCGTVDSHAIAALLYNWQSG